jgi:hypothetical protein
MNCRYNYDRQFKRKYLIKTSHIHVVLKPPHKNVLSGTLPLGLAGSGTQEKFRLTLELFKYRPLGDALLVHIL